MAVRALAITLIVSSHVHLFTALGGAHLLLALSGWNFARFQAGANCTRILTSVARIAVPCVVSTAFMAWLHGGYDVANFLLVNNYVDTGPWLYWYVEVLVQILVVLGLLSASQRFRSLNQRFPFGLPCAALFISLVPRELATSVGDPDERIFTTHLVLWFFLLGWAVQKAQSRSQKLLIGTVIVVLVPNYFLELHRGLIVAAGLLALMLVKQVRVPRPAGRALTYVAAASLHIYLLHYAIYLPLGTKVHPGVLVPLMLLTGVAAWTAARLSGRFLRRRFEVTAALQQRTAPVWVRPQSLR